MFKSTLILLICFLALAQSSYLVQQFFQKEDTKCERPVDAGMFTSEKSCYSMPPNYYFKNTCNSTHVEMEQMCNKDCSKCERKMAYPINTCLTGFINLKLSCPSKLPKLDKEGIYLRLHGNKECKSVGEYGQFATKGICQNHVAERVFGMNLKSNPGKSTRSFYDKDKHVYRLVSYSEKDCQGNVERRMNWPVDVCMKIPDPPAFSLKAQPATYLLLSRK